MTHLSQMPADVYAAVKRLFPHHSLIVQSPDVRTVRLGIMSCRIEIKLSQLQELATVLGTEDITVEVGGDISGDISGYDGYQVATVECEITCTGVDILGLGRGDDGK